MIHFAWRYLTREGSMWDHIWLVDARCVSHIISPPKKFSLLKNPKMFIFFNSAEKLWKRFEIGKQKYKNSLLIGQVYRTLLDHYHFIFCFLTVFLHLVSYHLVLTSLYTEFSHYFSAIFFTRAGAHFSLTKIIMHEKIRT